MTYKLLLPMIFSVAMSGCGSVPPQPPAPAGNAELLLRVLASLGIDYRNGGQLPQTGFDCSGLVAHVYREAFGIRLPHDTLGQSRVGSAVGRDELAPGDLVFYNTLGRQFSHVGIYIGEGRFVHAPKSGSQVRVEPMQSRYWSERFSGARRISVTL